MTRLSAVVPTLGKSPWLERCLVSLRRSGGRDLELILVDQSQSGIGAAHAAWVDNCVRVAKSRGFAAATNAGLRSATEELVAVVNDDAWVDESWCGALVSALSSHPRVGAVQGVNFCAARESMAQTPAQRCDGAGLGWNRWWQAVQLGRGSRWAGPSAEVDVFGVSATAAIYRRSALAEVARGGAVFDERLVSYYEDVDLACRLKAAGWQSLLVPKAVAWHVGSATGRQLGQEMTRLLYGNRILVLARYLGRAFLSSLPRILIRDGLDLMRRVGRFEWSAAVGIGGGWLRAARLLSQFGHLGEPMLERELRGQDCLPWMASST